MPRLFVDSSTAFLHIGIELCEGDLEFEASRIDEGIFKIQDLPIGLAEELPGHVKDLCKEFGSNVSDILEIVCSLGPGSYTGLRTCLAFCQGIAFGTIASTRNSNIQGVEKKGARMIGVSTFLADSYYVISTREGGIQYGRPFTVVIQGNKSEFFISKVTFNNLSDGIDLANSPFEVGPVEVVSIETFEENMSKGDTIGEIIRLDREHVSINKAQSMGSFLKAYSENVLPKGIVSTNKDSLNKFNNHLSSWYFGETVPEPLYVKGLPAKTLKERGK